MRQEIECPVGQVQDQAAADAIAQAKVRALVSGAVDDLFRVRAEIKRLTEVETNIKEIIQRDGHAIVDGSFVQAVVKTISPADTTDYKGLIAHLKVKPAVLAKFAKAKAAYVTITLKPLEH